MSNEIWLKSHADRAERLWRSGWTARQIANVMSKSDRVVTRNAVIGLMHRKGLSGRDDPISLPGPVWALPEGCVAA